MTYEQANITFKYIYNRIDYEKFYEIMKSIDEYFSDAYIEDKWNTFKSDMYSFIFTWEVFYDRVVNEIEKIDYNG